MKPLCKSITAFFLGLVVSANVLAQDPAGRTRPGPAIYPNAELYGTLVLNGVATLRDLRTLAHANCDGDLSDDELAAVRAWLGRMGIDCNEPE